VPAVLFLSSLLPLAAAEISFTVGGFKSGRTVRIESPRAVRVRASAKDPEGVNRLEIRSGDGRILLAAQCDSPRPELSLFGETMLESPGNLRARVRNGKGEWTDSAPVNIACTVLTPPARRGPVVAYPLGDITTPAAKFKLYFRIEARRAWEGTLFIRPGGTYRIRPREFPFHALEGDGVTLGFELLLPPKGPFPARLPLSIGDSGIEAWRGTVLVSPWEITRFKPAGRPVLLRRGKRIGLVARDLVLETVKPAGRAVKLILDCFSEGWEGTKVRVEIAQPIPRLPVTLERTLPERRAWEAVTFELDEIPLAAGGTITVNAESKGKVLVGGVRVIEG